jgi:uncharacterized Zn-binding protein involved in type VI secretion
MGYKKVAGIGDTIKHAIGPDGKIAPTSNKTVKVGGDDIAFLGDICSLHGIPVIPTCQKVLAQGKPIIVDGDEVPCVIAGGGKVVVEKDRKVLANV